MYRRYFVICSRAAREGAEGADERRRLAGSLLAPSAGAPRPGHHGRVPAAARTRPPPAVLAPGTNSQVKTRIAI